ncbi:MAG TPA: hypothetical protein VHI95_11585, partial [Acidimicrobiales bacterium]|nr:hypothetical protein [Acidimicrobiales bacterium]
MFAVVAEVTGGDWASFRLTDDFAAAAAVGSLAFVAFTVGMTSMRFAGDWLQLRIGRVSLHRFTVAIAIGGFALASLASRNPTIDAVLLGTSSAFCLKATQMRARPPPLSLVRGR